MSTGSVDSAAATREHGPNLTGLTVKQRDLDVDKDTVTNFFFWGIIGLLVGVRLFSTIYALTGGGPGYSTTTLSIFVYNTGLRYYQAVSRPFFVRFLYF